MKININKIKTVPKMLSDKFTLCVFGTPDTEVQEWINANNFKTNISKNFTNIIIPDNIKLNEIFNEGNTFEWMDGFSPNLNKKLHIGHFSNLVLGKAFKSLDVCKNTVSIYGDLLDGETTKEEALTLLKGYQTDFNFFSDKDVMASEVKYQGKLLKDGTGDYEGTKIFEIGDEKVVGIKSDDSTSYFYQDVALAEMLNAPTLYLTGNEQSNHFSLLKNLFPHIEHVGLGLIKLNGVKMSSRMGNVIFIDEFIESSKEMFGDDLHLIYNVFAGLILKSNPDVDKNINLDLISNPKNSAGLYLSYTMARLKSAGCESIIHSQFISRDLEFAHLKTKITLKPNTLFLALIEHCKDINALYTKYTIKGDKDVKTMFEIKLSDLLLGCKELGLFVIDKV